MSFPTLTPHPVFRDMRGSGTLNPLPPSLQYGLIAVTMFGFLSTVSTIILLCALSWRIWTWKRQAYHANQFVFLIYFLILSDVQQALGFLLNAHWLMRNSIDVGTSTCWAQGWFLSTGDFGSGLWSFAIGLHTFAAVIFGFKLSNKWFFVCVGLCWVLIYGLALVSVIIHPQIFVRAVSWCWIDQKYTGIKTWLHYAWIFFFEIGTLFVYVTMIIALHLRIKNNFYRSAGRTRNARDAAYRMTFYPVVYVVCTLPLAALRTYSMANPNMKISAAWFCFAGAMTTSNGWCDVLLYSLTRRLVLFGSEPPMDNGIETFLMPWQQNHFGTETTCVHVPRQTSPSNDRDYDNASQELAFLKDKARQPEGNEVLDFAQIKERVTVEIKSEPMSSAQLRQMEAMKGCHVSMDGGGRLRKLVTRDINSDSTSVQQLWPSNTSHASSHEDMSSINKSIDDSPVQRRVNETPHSERSISGADAVDSIDFQTRARGL